MRTMHRNIVAALLFSKDNKLFMALRDSDGGGVYVDTWQIPGGGIEKNETKEEAIIREIAEETGIDIANKRLILVDDTGQGKAEKTLRETGERVVVAMDFYVYKVQLPMNSDAIDVVLGDEFTSFRWFALSALPHLNLAPPSRALFKKLHYLPEL